MMTKTEFENELLNLTSSDFSEDKLKSFLLDNDYEDEDDHPLLEDPLLESSINQFKKRPKSSLPISYIKKVVIGPIIKIKEAEEVQIPKLDLMALPNFLGLNASQLKVSGCPITDPEELEDLCGPSVADLKKIGIKDPTFLIESNPTSYPLAFSQLHSDFTSKESNLDKEVQNDKVREGAKSILNNQEENNKNVNNKNVNNDHISKIGTDGYGINTGVDPTDTDMNKKITESIHNKVIKGNKSEHKEFSKNKNKTLEYYANQPTIGERLSNDAGYIKTIFHPSRYIAKLATGSPTNIHRDTGILRTIIENGYGNSREILNTASMDKDEFDAQFNAKRQLPTVETDMSSLEYKRISKDMKQQKSGLNGLLDPNTLQILATPIIQNMGITGQIMGNLAMNSLVNGGGKR